MRDDRRSPGWVLAAGLLLFALPALAAPRNALIPFNIPAQPLADAVVEFARQADISIGYPGLSFGDRKSPGVIGYYDLGSAIERLLEGTGFTYRIIDDKTVRILRAPPRKSRPARRTVPAPQMATAAIEEVVVTTTKRAGKVQSLPYSIAAVTGTQLRQWNIEDDTEVVLRVAGVTMTNRGTGRNKIILRGLSDGMFTGRTQSAVGLYLDDTRITYNAPDPGLKLLDVERVEVLRGPQGTLYGAGSLGGLFRIVTNKPVLDEFEASAGTSSALTRNGDPSFEAQAMINLPLAEDVLALRIVGYHQEDGGYIDDVLLGLNDVNTTTTTGTRIGLRWQMTDRWRITAGFNFQKVSADDTQYYDGNLAPLQRANLLREPHDNNFLQSYLTVDGSFSWGDLVSSTSYIRHDIDDFFDASRAVPAISGLPVITSPFSERRDIQTVIHETRATSNDDARLQWLAGVFFSHRDEVFTARLEIPGSGSALGFGPSDVLFSERRVDDINEVAVFGELTFFITRAISLTAGLRWFHSSLAATSLVEEPLVGPPNTTIGRSSKHGVTPKFVIGVQLRPDVLLYAQAAEGNRVGGINLQGPLVLGDEIGGEPDGSAESSMLTTFPSDHLWNFEVGAKTSYLNRRLIINVTGFYVIWNEIQSDQVGPNGFPFVTDAGDATIRGIEAEITARPSRRLTLQANVTWNDASLTEANVALGAKIDNQLPGVAIVSTGAAARYQIPLGPNVLGSIGADYAYVGKSSLAFDTEGSPRMGGYHVGNLRLSASWTHWRASLYIDNLWNEGANTFAFGNPFSLGKIPQVTPLRPRTVGLRLNWIY